MLITVDELQARWPLFRYEPGYNNLKKVPMVTVYLCPWKGDKVGSSTTLWSEDNTLSDDAIERLDRDHNRQKVFVEYMEKYPNLYFYIEQTPPHVASGIWVRRNERDNEAMGFGRDELRDPVLLDHLNHQAGKAKQEGWFWCSGCDEPHERDDEELGYAYFYFAGNYCKKWKEEHPGHYRDAMNESYN